MTRNSNEEQLRKWQEANNVISIDEQISRHITALAERERALQQTDAELSWSWGESVRDPLVAKLKGDLIAAEVALQEALQRYTENDRRVQEKRDQVDLIKKELQAVEKGFLPSLASWRVASWRRSVRSRVKRPQQRSATA
jgi:hypothetical protein